MLAFALFRLPEGEFPIERKLSWMTVGLAFLTLYFLLDTIAHLPCIFSMVRSSEYSKWGKVLNGTIICVLFIGIAFVLVSKLYTPDTPATEPVLREDSERAYITEECVPFAQRTTYIEHFRQGDILSITDYCFVSSGFADLFFEQYCEEIEAKEITEISSDICNELVNLFRYAEKKDTRIFSNSECNLFLVKSGSRVVRFGVSSDMRAGDIYRWLKRPQ